MTDPWKDRDTLVKLYHEEGLSARKIGAKLGCAHTTILYWMERFGIDRETPTIERPTSHLFTEFGYEAWSPTIDGESKWVLVHRLQMVAEHGLEAVSGKEVHHKNEVKFDNRPENLELVSKKDHSRHHMTKNEPWDYGGKRGPQRG